MCVCNNDQKAAVVQRSLTLGPGDFFKIPDHNAWTSLAFSEGRRRRAFPPNRTWLGLHADRYSRRRHQHSRSSPRRDPAGVAHKQATPLQLHCSPGGSPGAGRHRFKRVCVCPQPEKKLQLLRRGRRSETQNSHTPKKGGGRKRRSSFKFCTELYARNSFKSWQGTTQRNPDPGGGGWKKLQPDPKENEGEETNSGGGGATPSGANRGDKIPQREK